MELNLRDRVALVTGAGRGIGAAIASALAAEGCAVWVADLDIEAASATASRLGPRCRALRLDVGDPEDAARAVRHVLDTHGGIDVLVNNAGILKTGALTEATTRDWDEVCRVNLSGVYYCSKAVLPSMLARRAGRIINMASVSAFKGGGAIGNVLYGATKAGVVALTQGFARELGPHGITVNAIAPAVADTAMTNPVLSDDNREAVRARIPLGRLATPGDIARVAVMLASDAFGYLNGDTIVVDGGFLTR